MEKIQSVINSITKESSSYKKMSLKELKEWQVDNYNKMAGDLNKYDNYNCDKCKNRGYIMILQEEKNGDIYTPVTPCKCQKTRKILAQLKKSGLKNAEKSNFKAFETTELWQKSIKDKAYEFATTSTSEWFYIGGQSGCGKTHLCTAICLQFLKQDKAVYYMLWREESTNLKGIVSDDTATYAKKIDNLKNVDVLYIDDLFKTGKGAEPTVADVNLAFEILNHRYNNGKITVISSELSINQLLEIDEAVAGRIVERTAQKYAIVINKDTDKNYRLKGITNF